MATGCTCNNQSMNELSQHDPQVKRVTVLATAVMKSESTVEDRLRRISEWKRAKKAVRLILSYVNRLRELAKKQNQSRNESITIKVEDTQQAGTSLSSQFKIAF